MALAQIDRIIAFEEGNISNEDTISLFQSLIDSGEVWSLQGMYGRTAAELIREGLCHQATPRVLQS